MRGHNNLHTFTFKLSPNAKFESLYFFTIVSLKPCLQVIQEQVKGYVMTLFEEHSLGSQRDVD